MPLQRPPGGTPSKFDAPVRFEANADPKALIGRAELLLDDAMAVLARAKADDDSRLGLQAVRECRSSLELLMKAHGMLVSEGAVNVHIDARRKTVELLAKLTEDDLRALIATRSGEAKNALADVTDNRGLLESKDSINSG